MIEIITNRPKEPRRGTPYYKAFEGTTIFVNSNASKTIDEFFLQNEIFNLDFKSKTWSKMVRLSTKMDIREIMSIFPKGAAPVSITYSKKAGCSCGCSPGYIVKLPIRSGLADDVDHYEDFRNRALWVNIVHDKDLMDGLEAKIPQYKQLLDEEIVSDLEHKAGLK